MKAIIFYRPHSEHARMVEEYAREFTRRTGRELELQDIDTRDSIQMLELYDIVRNPALVVLRNDRQLLKMWIMDETPPLINEVNGYLEE